MRRIIYLIPVLALSAAIARADSFETDRTSGAAAFAKMNGARAITVAEMSGQVPQAPAVEDAAGGDMSHVGPIYSNLLKAEALFASSTPPSADALLGSWDLVTAASKEKMGNFGFVAGYLSFIKTETGITAKTRKGLGYADHAVTLTEASAMFSETKKMGDYNYAAETRCRLAAQDRLVCEIQAKVDHPEKRKQLSNTYLMLKRH